MSTRDIHAPARWDHAVAGALSHDCTREEIREHLRLDDAESDSYVDGLIARSFRRFEKGAGWWTSMGPRTLSVPDGAAAWQAADLWIPRGFVAGFLGATVIRSSDWGRQAVDAADWTARLEQGRLLLRYGGSATLPDGDLELQVSAGYATGTLPEDIRDAVYLTAGALYRFREELTLAPASLLPLGATRIMMSYRDDRLDGPVR